MWANHRGIRQGLDLPLLARVPEVYLIDVPDIQPLFTVLSIMSPLGGPVTGLGAVLTGVTGVQKEQKRSHLSKKRAETHYKPVGMEPGLLARVSEVHIPSFTPFCPFLQECAGHRGLTWVLSINNPGITGIFLTKR